MSKYMRLWSNCGGKGTFQSYPSRINKAYSILFLLPSIFPFKRVGVSCQSLPGSPIVYLTSRPDNFFSPRPSLDSHRISTFSSAYMSPFSPPHFHSLRSYHLFFQHVHTTAVLNRCQIELKLKSKYYVFKIFDFMGFPFKILKLIPLRPNLAPAEI
jgi:hypothetical protein